MGGENPALPYVWVRDMVAGIRKSDPDVHIKAFTASEIEFFAKTEALTAEEILLDLKEAGLNSLPGGGAEILAAGVRAQVCPAKISGERWLEIHQLAHDLGIRTNATMLYGHVESHADRADHLIRLREAQDETGGFQAFIPLAFQPHNNALAHLPGPTGVDDLKVMAVSRLMLDNFDHIKTYWVMTGLKLAQIALFFGANDMDGTVVEEVISLLSGAEHGQAVSKAELVRVIGDVGPHAGGARRAVSGGAEVRGRRHAAAAESAAARHPGTRGRRRTRHDRACRPHPGSRTASRSTTDCSSGACWQATARWTGRVVRRWSSCRACPHSSTRCWRQGRSTSGPSAPSPMPAIIGVCCCRDT